MPMPNYPKRGRLSLFPVPGCAEVPTDIYTLDLYCSGARGIWRGQTDGPGQPIRRLAMAGSARGGPGAVRCLECGAETAEAGPFCARCGAPTGMPTADPVPPASRAVRRRPGIIAVAAGVAVACLVTALAVISGRPGTSSRPCASAAPAAPSATVRWINDTGYDIASGPAVTGGTVYVGSSDGTVYALDAATGSVRWTYTTAGSVDSGPAAAGGTVYVSDVGQVYALDVATGRLRWAYTTGGAVGSSPAAAGGTVYIGSDDGTVYALDAGS